MNLEKLHEAEASFLLRYPQGFADPAIAPLRKKHNVAKLIGYAQEALVRPNFSRPDFIADALVAIVSRSSMISRFEKPPFKAFVAALGSPEKEALAQAAESLLYGRKQAGFEALVGMLSHHRIAKWSVLSAIPFHVAPQREVFVKPSTAKGIIRLLGVEDLVYQATPTWRFYQGYRALIRRIRREVHPSLAPNNAALTGFLMMSL